jgi:hypothetical protein
MRFLTFASPEDIRNPCLGEIIDDIVVDLAELRTWAQGARFIPSENLPESLIGLIFAMKTLCSLKAPNVNQSGTRCMK